MNRIDQKTQTVEAVCGKLVSELRKERKRVFSDFSCIIKENQYIELCNPIVLLCMLPKVLCVNSAREAIVKITSIVIVSVYSWIIQCRSKEHNLNLIYEDRTKHTLGLLYIFGDIFIIHRFMAPNIPYICNKLASSFFETKIKVTLINEATMLLMALYITSKNNCTPSSQSNVSLTKHNGLNAPKALSSYLACAFAINLIGGVSDFTKTMLRSICRTYILSLFVYGQLNISNWSVHKNTEEFSEKVEKRICGVISLSFASAIELGQSFVPWHKTTGIIACSAIVCTSAWVIAFVRDLVHHIKLNNICVKYEMDFYKEAKLYTELENIEMNKYNSSKINQALHNVGLGF